MEMKKKQVYLAPALTVVTFRAERGYAISGVERDGFLGLMFESDEGSENLESRNDDNHYFWGGNDWN